MKGEKRPTLLGPHKNRRGPFYAGRPQPALRRPAACALLHSIPPRAAARLKRRGLEDDPEQPSEMEASDNLTKNKKTNPWMITCVEDIGDLRQAVAEALRSSATASSSRD